MGEAFLAAFLTANNLCPECAGTLQQAENEKACTECGLVLGESHFTGTQPFGTSNKISKRIAFEDGLGDTLGLTGIRAMAWKSGEKKPFKCTNSLCDYEGPYVCPKCQKEVNDYPLRANQLVLLSRNFEHPKIRMLKKIGAQRAKDFGFDDRRDGGKDTIFMTYFTDRAKRVAAHYIVQNARVSIQKLADVCFAFTAKDLLGIAKFQEIKQQLCIDDKFIEDFGVIYETHARKVKK